MADSYYSYQYPYTTPYLYSYYNSPQVSPFVPPISFPPSPEPPRRQVHFEDEHVVSPRTGRPPSWHAGMTPAPNPAPFPSPPFMYQGLPAMVPLAPPSEYTHHRRRSDGALPQPTWVAVPAYPTFLTPPMYSTPLPARPMHQLHPLLSGEGPGGPPLLFDLSLHSFKAARLTGAGRSDGVALSKEELSQLATHPSVKRMTITCEAIPKWPIELKPPEEKSNFLTIPFASHDVPITLGDVLIAIHKELQRPITHVDWAKLSQENMTKVARAYTRRCRTFASVEAFERSQGVRRVDYLFDNYMFKGLVRSKAGQEDYEKLKLLVGPRQS